MKQLYPDIEWYTEISRNLGVSHRCPFASVHRCPRYFQGVSLLGDQGLLSRFDSQTDQDIGEKWEATDIWPAAWHEYSGISSSDGRPFLYRDFCPEIAAQAFGLFAATLIRYSDEIDQASAHGRLKSNPESVDKDWRWRWSSVSEMHYTNCPVYSLLSANLKPLIRKESTEPVFTAKPGFFGFSVDLMKLFEYAKRRWLSRKK